MDITKLGFGTVERMLESMGDIVVYKTVQKQYIDHENRIASRDVKLVRLKPEELEKAVEKEKQAALRLGRSWPIPLPPEVLERSGLRVAQTWRGVIH